MQSHYLFLIAAVCAEVVGTMSLQASHQFTRLWPSVLCVCAFLAALYLMSLALKAIPVGILYAMWSGLGIMLIAGSAWLIFGQKLDLPAIIGLAMIISGIVVIQAFSSTAPH